MINILVADDHALVRKGLEMIIRSAFSPCEITYAENGTEVFKHIRKSSYDLVILDLNMPDTDAVALFQHIMSLHPTQRVLICSMNPEKIFAMRYLKLGAAGYVEKSAKDDILERAIRTVLNGRRYFSEDMLDQIAGAVHNNIPSNPFDSLTDREFEIALHLIKGLSVGEIAQMIRVHTSTVGTQRARILEKTGVQNVMELNQLARTHHIVEW
jgi:two-component system, NarL family, invasion response regulator UvrY